MYRTENRFGFIDRKDQNFTWEIFRWLLNFKTTQLLTQSNQHVMRETIYVLFKFLSKFPMLHNQER